MKLEHEAEYGKRLIAAREKMGITLEEISYELKISLNTLKNLEASDSKSLPKPGFTRGFIKVYCQFLNISPALVLDEYNKTINATDAKPRGSVLVETSEPKSFFILDFLKDQFFPLILFSSVVGAAFVLYTFLGSYEGSHSKIVDSPIEDKMVDELNPVGEISAQLKKDLSEGLKETKNLEAETADTLQAIGIESEETEAQEQVQEEKTSAPLKVVTIAEDEQPKVEEKVLIEPKPKYVPPTGKHQLVVEPLAGTYLYIKTDKDSRAVRAKLVPDKTRTFRFDQAEVRFLDAGAVNVSLDGEELGALGVFGEEKKIDFPSLKEI